MAILHHDGLTHFIDNFKEKVDSTAYTPDEMIPKSESYSIDETPTDMSGVTNINNLLRASVNSIKDAEVLPKNEISLKLNDGSAVELIKTSIAYGGGYWVAISTDRYILESIDGINWSKAVETPIDRINYCFAFYNTGNEFAIFTTRTEYYIYDAPGAINGPYSVPSDIDISDIDSSDTDISDIDIRSIPIRKMVRVPNGDSYDILMVKSSGIVYRYNTLYDEWSTQDISSQLSANETITNVAYDEVSRSIYFGISSPTNPRIISTRDLVSLFGFDIYYRVFTRSSYNVNPYIAFGKNFVFIFAKEDSSDTYKPRKVLYCKPTRSSDFSIVEDATSQYSLIGGLPLYINNIWYRQVNASEGSATWYQYYLKDSAGSYKCVQHTMWSKHELDYVVYHGGLMYFGSGLSGPVSCRRVALIDFDDIRGTL